MFDNQHNTQYRFFKTMDRIVLYFFIFGYSYLIVYATPWIELLGKEWADIANYLFRIEYLARGGEERVSSGISLLFSEFLWKGIILSIGEFFSIHREGLYFVSYLSLLLYSFFTFRRVNVFFGISLMTNPMLIDLILGQIRMGLAFPILLLAYHFRKRKYIAFSIMLVAILIHSATILFIIIYMILKLIDQRKYIDKSKFYLFSMGFGIFMALVIKFGVVIILAVVGDRRADNYAGDSFQSSSLAFSIPWFIVALILVWKASHETEEERMITSFSIMMISIFFAVSALHMYGQRYVAISIPLIIVAIGYLPKHFKQWTWVYLFFYQFLQWKYRIVYTII